MEGAVVTHVALGEPLVVVVLVDKITELVSNTTAKLRMMISTTTTAMNASLDDIQSERERRLRDSSPPWMNLHTSLTTIATSTLIITLTRQEDVVSIHSEIDLSSPSKTEVEEEEVEEVDQGKGPGTAAGRGPDWEEEGD